MRQHLKNHRDIEIAGVMYLSATELDEIEKVLIKRFEGKFATRNIMHAFSTNSFTPLDRFLSESDRSSFLMGETLKIGEPRALDLLTQKSDQKFERMRRHNKFLKVANALGIFVQRCIPIPFDTEARFWSVTAKSANGFLLRVNVGQQEVFTIDDQGGILFARVFAGMPLSYDSEGPMYATDSHCHWVPIRDLDVWLKGKNINGIRSLVVQLMRHTTPMNLNSHCPQLVRAAIS